MKAHNDLLRQLSGKCLVLAILWVFVFLVHVRIGLHGVADDSHLHVTYAAVIAVFALLSAAREAYTYTRLVRELHVAELDQESKARESRVP